ncbi:AzlD domain-containing protein [Actinospongicola halichondriae]|uniref:AzlD domain-containing protein n=1 Tax=Actinospongicola halichondriae TaxID=3236844 RepID=UPI003D5570F7
MSTTMTVLVGLTLGTYALKSAGPLLLGGRRLPPMVDALSNRIPAALLAALVVVSTIADGQRVVVDARLGGVIVAGVALRLRAPFVVVVLAAVAATAAIRAIS